MKTKNAWVFVVIILIMAPFASAKPPSKGQDDVFRFGLISVQKTSLDKLIKKLGNIIKGEGYQFTVDDTKQGEVTFILDKPMSSEMAMTYTLDTVRDVLGNSGGQKKTSGSNILIQITPVYQHGKNK